MKKDFTIDNLLIKFKNWFDRYRKTIFLVTFIIGMIVHFELYANELVAYDGYWHYGSFIAKGWEISLGRFFIPFVDILRGTLVVSVLTTTISMLIMSFTSIFLCDLLNIKKMYLKIFVSLLLVSIPSFSLTLMYAYTADSYTYALFLSVLTVYFLNKSKNMKNTIFAVISLILTLGFYQPYLCVIVTLFLIVNLIKIFEDTEINVKNFFKTFFFDVLALIIGIILYYICFNFVVKVLHLNITDYSGGNKIFSIDTIKNIFPSIKNTYLTFYDFFFTDNIVINSMYLGKKIINLLAFILILVNFVILILNNKTYKQTWKIFVIIVALIVYPILSCIIELIAQNRDMNLLMSTSLYLPFVLLIKQIDLIKYNKFNNIMNIFSVIVILATIWTFIISDNATYTASNLFNTQMSAVRK